MVGLKFKVKHGKVQCHRMSGSKCENIYQAEKMIDDMAISLHHVVDEMVESGFRPLSLDVPV